MAERLQHVEATKDEACVVWHNSEPIGPVRLSCQHLFCRTFAHITSVPRDTCPFCLRQPSPTKISAQNPKFVNDLDSRLRGIYPTSFLASASHIAVLSAYWEDGQHWVDVQALIYAQQVCFVVFSIALAVVYLSRKAVASITR